MIIKIDDDLSAERVIKVVENLLRRNQPISENKALAITIVDIIEEKPEIKKIEA
jgi:hypothetical protein